MGRGEEATSPGGIGVTGGGRGGDHSLWDPSCPGCLHQLSREISIGGKRQLDSGGQQPSYSMTEVGVDDKGADQGGCRLLDLSPY